MQRTKWKKWERKVNNNNFFLTLRRSNGRTYLEACKNSQMCFAARPHVKLKQKLEFLLTAFAVILTPVALAIVPKLEFDFKVIMCVAIFCFLSAKSCFEFANCCQNLSLLESVYLKPGTWRRFQKVCTRVQMPQWPN